jgi:DNA-binding CsgD family transcriptional regulator
MAIVGLSKKQEIALRLHKQLGSTNAVARVMGIAPENASRLLTRGRRVLRQVQLVAAVGGDPLEAIDSIRAVLNV